MYCPVKSDHQMVEVAPGLLQCSHCGFGPSRKGSRPFWALSDVEEFGAGEMGATCICFDPTLDGYVMTDLEWEVDDEGRVIPHSLKEVLLQYLTTKKELEAHALPVVIRSEKKWDHPQGSLHQMMFEDPLGPKEIGLTVAKPRRSSR